MIKVACLCQAKRWVRGCMTQRLSASRILQWAFTLSFPVKLIFPSLSFFPFIYCLFCPWFALNVFMPSMLIGVFSRTVLSYFSVTPFFAREEPSPQVTRAILHLSSVSSFFLNLWRFKRLQNTNNKMHKTSSK